MHRLVLPLPKDFKSATVLGDQGEYSVFDVEPGSEPPFLLPDAVRSYVTELAQFLQRHRLIQYHPENFFSYQLRSERETRGCLSDSEALHLDGTPILDDEVVSLRQLCSQFESLWTGSCTDASAEASALMSELVRRGPTAVARVSPTTHAEDDRVAALQDFYRTTQRLMLHRQRRDRCDYASLLFQQRSPSHAMRRGASGAPLESSTKAAPSDAAPLAASSSPAAEEVYRLLVDHNMGAKKAHEVHVMRTVIRSVFQLSLPPPAEVSSSVINIGEGKGYCSRVLALCDGIQVVGLDCNAHHKEGAAGRIEKALEGRLGAPGNTAGLPHANLLYHTRGYLASVTCRVEHPMNWEQVLAGHIPIVHDHDEPCGSERHQSGACVAVAAAASSEDSVRDCVAPTSTAGTAGHRRRALHEKAACRCCGHVMRVHHGAAIAKHVRDHVKKAEQRGADLVDLRTALPLAMQPQEFYAATASIPQDTWTDFLLREFFCDDDKMAPPSRRRSSTDGMKTAEPCCASGGDDDENATGAKSPTSAPSADLKRHRAETTSAQRASAAAESIDRLLCRGMRVDVRCLLQLELSPAKPISVPQGLRGDSETDTHSSGEKLQDDETAPKPTTVRRVFCHRLVTTTATVLGRDEGSQRYKLLLDPIVVDNAGERVSERLLSVSREDELALAANAVVTLPTHAVVLNADNLTKPFMCHVRGTSRGDAMGSSTSTREADAVLLGLVVEPSRAPHDGNATSSFAPAGALGFSAAALRFPKSTGVIPEVFILHIHPVAESRIVPICVPSLSNTLLMGLHPCGDLGSNICRLFASSKSAALVLVSCCWHALTRQGFPLSRTVTSLGVRTESVSLMLATQPFDMWGSVSADGHRGSARLLFFRSLLDLLWRQLAASFPESPCLGWPQGAGHRVDGVNVSRVGPNNGRCCALPPPPHLEPSFLRQMAKVKASISFAEFVEAAFRQYFGTYEQCIKTMSHVPHSNDSGDAGPDDSEVERRHFSGRASIHFNCSGTLCNACYHRMRSLFLDAAPLTTGEGSCTNASLSPVFLLAHHLEEVHMQRSFPSFLGLTVLRMWMSHLVEALLLVDRALYLHEMLLESTGKGNAPISSDVALVPLFDGALSPRMFGILARRLAL